MAKKKKKGQQRSSSASGARPKNTLNHIIKRELTNIDQYLAQDEVEEALVLLTDLNQRYPKNEAILKRLVETSFTLRDMWEYMNYAREFIAVRSDDDPDIYWRLALTYIFFDFYVHALEALEIFKDKIDIQEDKMDVIEKIANIKEFITSQCAEYDMDFEEGKQFIEKNEQIWMRLDGTNPKESLQLAEELIQIKPNFLPAHMSIGQAYFVNGQKEKAIETARYLLEHMPSEPQAHFQLIHFLFLSGQFEAATEQAEQFKNLPVSSSMQYFKLAETFSYLGNNEEVIKAFKTYKETYGEGQKKDMLSFNHQAIFHHLAAVATMRLGNQQQAEDLWKTALKIYPGLRIAEDNFDELFKAPSERYVAWHEPLSGWLIPADLMDIPEFYHPIEKHTPEEINAKAKEVQQWLKDKPHIEALIPKLLELGDPLGCNLALDIAMNAQLPELNHVLANFARGQIGPDNLRYTAAMVAQRAGVIPAGTTSMWLQGEWTDIMLLDFFISYESTEYNYSPKVRKLVQDGITALQEQRIAKALQILQQAESLAPNDLTIRQNLAIAYQVSGDEERAYKMFSTLHEEHPDYIFTAVSLSQMFITQGNIDRAREKITSLLQRKEFHIDEFIALCKGHINLALAKDKQSQAQQWLSMWKYLEPEHPEILAWQYRVNKQEILRQFLSKNIRDSLYLH